MSNDAHILRRGSCSCMPERIILPEYLTVDFIHQGQKVTLPFTLQHIVIPQEEETMARFESRVHIFTDSHERRASGNWLTSVELCDIRLPDHPAKPYQYWRFVRTETEDLVIYTERWRTWLQPTLPSSHDVLRALKVLLQRHKRKLGWDAFHAWLAHMTPAGWTLPESFTVIEST